MTNNIIRFIQILLLFINPIFSLPYETIEIDGKAGIYYHNLGIAKISNDHYTLLSYINISFYHEKLHVLKNVYDQTSYLCFSHLRETVACQNSVKLSQIHLPHLENKFDTIAHLVGHSSVDFKTRKRRGLFNGVSNVFNWLFGTPDADDAQFYSESIKNLQSNEHDIELLMKQQIHVISSAIKSYNESAQSLKVNEAKLNANIEKFNKFSKSVANDINLLNQRQAVIDFISLLFYMSTELNEEFDNIISAILFAKQNTLHPSIISPKDFKKELSQIKLLTDAKFPISIHNYNDIYKYFFICKLSAIYDNEILIFAIKIPLVHQQVYNLYDLIPLPVRHYNTSIYSYVDSPFRYLLMSTTKTLYGRLKDLSLCNKISNEEYICANPTTHLTAERPVCETILMNKLQVSIPGSCPTRTVKADIEIWHPLSTNSWLYVMSTKTAASISCDKSNTKIFDVILNGTGILKMNTQCKCYTYSSVLLATSNQTSAYTSYVPSINIITDNCCIRHHEVLYQNEVEMEPLQLKNLNLDDLRHSQHKLEQFDEILQANINKSHIRSKSSWLLTLLSLATFILIVMLCCCCKCCRLSYFRRIFSEGKSCCGFPSICITNHNEKFSVNDEQMVRLSRLRSVYDEEDKCSVVSSELVPLSSS